MSLPQSTPEQPSLEPKSQETKTPETPSGASVIITLLLSFSSAAVLGLAIGIYTGLSKSPVVAVLLPLLFGLLAGASGLQISKLDLSSIAGIKSNSLICGALLMLSLTSLLGSALGIALRNGRVHLPWDARDGETLELIRQAVTSKTIPVSDLVEASIFESKLRSVGIDEETRKTVLLQILSGINSQRPIVGTRSQAITVLQKWNSAVAALNAACEPKAEPPDYRIDNPPDAVQRLQYLLNGYMMQLQGALAGNGEIQNATYRTVVGDGLAIIQHFLTDSQDKQNTFQGDLQWLVKRKFKLLLLLDLRQALLSVEAQLAAPGWQPAKPIGQDLDDYIAKVMGAKEPTVLVAGRDAEALANNNNLLRLRQSSPPFANYRKSDSSALATIRPMR
jgi:hypothetical protein